MKTQSLRSAKPNIRASLILVVAMLGLTACNNTLVGLRQDANQTAKAVDETLNGPKSRTDDGRPVTIVR